MSGRFKTLETVPIDTPAARATSLMIAEVRAMSPHPLDPLLSAVPSALHAERPLSQGCPTDPVVGHPTVYSEIGSASCITAFVYYVCTNYAICFYTHFVCTFSFV